jgi:hypothetical protein
VCREKSSSVQEFSIKIEFEDDNYLVKELAHITDNMGNNLHILSAAPAEWNQSLRSLSPVLPSFGCYC